ncbi:radical SAM peptide maturase [Tenacibaculum sp.]|uniref:radical SAM peptide maturase n=1 Tax=Tenacibaculum sp. TaxID=1906242 RepID=UPI003AA90F72
MLNYCTFTSNNGNHYFYDKENRMHICHPILAWLIDNPDFIPPKNENNVIYLKGYGEVLYDELTYYLKKYHVFVKNGYFNKEKKDEKFLSKRLTELDIEKSLANMRQVTFEVTDFCNIDCEYCFYSSLYRDYDERNNKKLDFQLAKNLIDFLVPKWNSSLNTSLDKLIYISFYGGEPLSGILVIKKIVNYIKSLDVKKNRFVFTMTTNAVMLAKHMDFIVENNFNLLISLDGDKENNQYRYLRNGKSSYDIVVKNIDLLREKYPDYFKTNVNFNAVIHNKNSVEEVNEFFKERYGKAPSIGDLNTSGIAPEYQEKFLEMYANSHHSYTKAKDKKVLENDMFLNLPIIKEMAGFLSTRSGSVYQDYNDLTSTKSYVSRKPTGTCTPFSVKMFVTVNGKLLPCETVGHQNGLGQVNRFGVTIDLKDITERYNTSYNIVESRCNSCNLNDSCSQCMIYNHSLDLDSAYAPPCSSYKNDKKFTDELAEKVSYLERNRNIYEEIMTKVITI